MGRDNEFKRPPKNISQSVQKSSSRETVNQDQLESHFNIGFTKSAFAKRQNEHSTFDLAKHSEGSKRWR
jgi:hypothetical protein